MLYCKLVYGDGPNPICQQVGLPAGQIKYAFFRIKYLFVSINKKKQIKIKYVVISIYSPVIRVSIGLGVHPKIPLQLC